MAQVQILRLVQVRAAIRSGEARRLRQGAKLSLAEVGAACGADQSTVWRWEMGKRLPRGELALAYGNVLDDLRRHAQNSSGHDDGARSSRLTPPRETASTEYQR